MSKVRSAIVRLRRIVLVTGDIAAASRFLVAAFDAEVVAPAAPVAALPLLLGVPDARVDEAVLRVGAQEVGLLAFDPPGRPYPAGSGSTDLWFQHFAVVVRDMEAASTRLASLGIMPISEGGPQRLPPSTGSVSAFKFRDGEGHPLELLSFPTGMEPAVWRGSERSRLCLGIDHSAIAVGDTERSLAFYRDILGLTPAAETYNQGAEQSRLDAVPDARVRVTGLHPAEATPHLELLGYETGSRRSIATDTTAADIAATTLVLETACLPDLVEGLTEAQARFVSPGIVVLDHGRRGIAVLDPDGHRLVIVEA